MILTGTEIAKQVASGEIVIDPFHSRNLTTNSYDFHLGGTIVTYRNTHLDPRIKNETLETKIPPQGLRLDPSRIYLGHTVEVVGSSRFVPVIRGRSSTGRLGLFVHITADLIDLGSENQLTLMMHAVQPTTVYAGMPIGQVTFWSVEGDIGLLYEGKYQGLSGPQPSQIYRDFVADGGG
jgi:dCTP deaminase